MKLYVKAENRRFCLWIPLCIWTVRLGLRIGRKYNDQVPDPNQIVPLVKALKAYRKKNGKFVLVEVVSPKEGATVKITV